MFDVKQIKPKVKGQSDKYSWNLYSWMNKYKKYIQYKVYYIGNYEFDKNNISLRNIVIGRKHSEAEMSGDTLYHIIHNGIKKDDSFCFLQSQGWNIKDAKDITDIFWKSYIQEGRCFLFGHNDVWLLGDENRYTYVGKSSRRCNWCGRWEQREILKETIIKRKEIWS